MDNNCTNDENLYQILEINEHASNDEIKKAYKKKVLQYHPDKNISKTSHIKFIKIKSAYEILINKESRQQYDKTLNNYDIGHLLNKKINSKKIDDFLKFINNIKENKYVTAFNYLLNKFIIDRKYLNIKEEIECDLIDRYNDNYMHINVIRKTRDNINLYVPLRNDINIFSNEGEKDNNGIAGDLILYTKTKNNMGYYSKNGDIYKKFNLNNNKNILIINYINGNILKININKNPEEKFYIFKNIGLPINNSNRGDFVCELYNQ
jgi:DnaJ-class molecular chaperone